jgi:F-type H+-transporting ATPase subunit epsilon
MKVKILAPSEKLLEEEAVEIILPGADGEFSVMEFHQPCLYRLRSGQIKVRLRQEKRLRKVPIKRGLASVLPNKLVALVEVI